MIKYKITKSNLERFFPKVGDIVFVDFEQQRIYSEDRTQWVPLDIVTRLGIEMERERG